MKKKSFLFTLHYGNPIIRSQQQNLEILPSNFVFKLVKQEAVTQLY